MRGSTYRKVFSLKTIEEIQAEQRAITDLATAESRRLTDEEADKYEALEGELKSVQRSEEIFKRQAAYMAPNASLAASVHVAAPKTDDTEMRAWASYLRTGKPNADLEARAQNEGTPSAGGYTVPTEFQNKIITRLKAFGGIAGASYQVTTDHGRPITWNTVDDVSNVGEIINEGDTFASGADVTFGQNELNVYQYTVGGIGSTPLRVSRQLVEDSAVDVVSYVSGLLATRIHRIQSQHFATGTGTGQPLGLVHGLTGIEIADDTKGIQYDDLVNWIHSVDQAYRAGSVWVLPDAVVKRIKLIKDSHGDPVFRSATADLSTGTGGDTILGYPVVTDNALPDIDVDSNTVNFGTFGRLSGEDGGYVVRRVLNDVQIEVDESRRRDYKQLEVFAWARAGATQQNTNAYVALTGEA